MAYIMRMRSGLAIFLFESLVMSLKVGDSFRSYTDLEMYIRNYERDNNVQLTLRDTRMLENARHRAPNRVDGANQLLKYYWVHYACVCGGKKYRSKSNGIHTDQRLVVYFTNIML